MCPDLPAAAHGIVGDLDQVIGIPVQISRVVRGIAIGLVKSSSLDSPIHVRLESPNAQPVVAEAATHSQAGDVRNDAGNRATRHQEHDLAAYCEFPALAQRLVGE